LFGKIHIIVKRSVQLNVKMASKNAETFFEEIKRALSKEKK
jgi:hypothetical protein